MADFIHCNSCNAIPDQSFTRKFFLSTCGHIICQVCIERTPKDQCRVCKKKCNAVEISKLDPKQQYIFMDPVVMAKKQQRQFVETLNFQKVHRTRYVQSLQHQLTQARKLQEYVKREVEKRKHFERENQDLKNQVAQLQQQLLQASALQTPRGTPAPFRFQGDGLDNPLLTQSVRTNLSNESGSNLPVGVEAATYRPNHHHHHQNHRNHREAAPMTPVVESIVSSPQSQTGFEGIGYFNLSRNSLNAPNRAGRQANPYDNAWQNNMPMPNINQAPRISHNASNHHMSNIVAAFQRGGI